MPSNLRVSKLLVEPKYWDAALRQLLHFQNLRRLLRAAEVESRLAAGFASRAAIIFMVDARRDSNALNCRRMNHPHRACCWWL